MLTNKSRNTLSQNPNAKHAKITIIERHEFNRLKIAILTILVLLTLAPGELIFFIPITHMFFLTTSGILALAFAVLMIWFIGETKDFHPKFYIVSLLVSVGAFLNNLTWFNFLLSQRYSDSFNGLNTLVDALYFTVGTISTAGTGNIYPVSQAAKLVVTCEVIVGFTLIVLVLVKESIGLKASIKNKQ